jgi:hypothetical protein
MEERLREEAQRTQSKRRRNKKDVAHEGTLPRVDLGISPVTKHIQESVKPPECFNPSTSYLSTMRYIPPIRLKCHLISMQLLRRHSVRILRSRRRLIHSGIWTCHLRHVWCISVAVRLLARVVLLAQSSLLVLATPQEPHNGNERCEKCYTAYDASSYRSCRCD